MIKIYQTKYSDNLGTKGNCFRACIASLFEIDIKYIPPFEDSNNWQDMFFDFLDLIDCEYEGIGKIENINNYEGINGYNIVYGESFRENVKNGHSVIFYKNEMIHDPHPSNTGLKTYDGFYMIKRKEKKKDEI